MAKTSATPRKQVQAYFSATPPTARAALRRIRSAILSAVRLPLTKPIPVGLVKKLVKARVTEMRR